MLGLVRLLAFGLLVVVAGCADEAPASSPERAAEPDAKPPAKDPILTPSNGNDGGASNGTPTPGADDPGPPFVDVPASGSYGTRTFAVPAAAHWVNSGLYLRAGTSASIVAKGTWRAAGNNDATSTGPAGVPNTTAVRGCAPGSLVARLGLAYDGPIFCVGESAAIASTMEGILYLAANVTTDLGDFYAARHSNTGKLDVTVTSTGTDTVPTIAAAAAATYNFAAVTSGWVELRSEHITVTVPKDIAMADRATAADSLKFLDSIYDEHAKLRGRRPYHGERVRFFPDDAIENIGYMLAGNPVRMNPGILSGDAPIEHFLRSSNAAHGVWGFAHELGHDFTVVDPLWYYEADLMEAWPNIFSVTTLRALGRPDPGYANNAAYPSSMFCPTKDAYLAAPSFETLKNDPFMALCFLLDLQAVYGPNLYKDFWAKLNVLPWNAVPTNSSAAVQGWVRDQMNVVAGKDTTPIFTKWGLPLP